MKDWESHQNQPLHVNKRKNPFNNAESNNARLQRRLVTKEQRPAFSVQDRLRLAALKEAPNSQALEDAETQKAEDVNRVASVEIIEKVENDYNDGQFDTESMIISSQESSSDEEIKPDAKVENVALRYAQLYKSTRALQLDAHGYSRVKVTFIERNPENDSALYYLVPLAVDNELYNYKVKLSNTYNDPLAVRLDSKQLMTTMPALFIAKIGNIWSRCIAASVECDGSVHAIDIDSGTKKILNILHDELKPAGQSEYETMAFCVKADLLNIEKSDVEIEDIIEIKVLETLEDGVIAAEVNFDYESSDEGANEPLMAPPPTPNVSETEITAEEEEEPEERFTIKSIKLKVLKPGNVKLSFLDGSRLAEGKMCVCESTTEHSDFFEMLEKEIDNYIKTNPTADYRPM
jgi:hypothetical protein